MKNSKTSIIFRSISGFLAFLTVFTLLASLSLVPVFAAEEKERTFKDAYTDYYINPDYVAKESDKAYGITAAPDFKKPENRIKAMKLMNSNAYFELYVDSVTGEVALKDKSTGDIMFSNPYDIPEYAVTNLSSISNTIKPELLSQVEISYEDNGSPKTYNSFNDAALLGQITVKQLRGGVRIEYSIGEEESRTLVPRRFRTARYEDKILAPYKTNIMSDDSDYIPEEVLLKLTAWYETYTIDDNMDPTVKKDLENQYPELKKYPDGITVCTCKNYREIKALERYIKTYCPNYTFEELDKDHMEVGYTEKDKAPANFRMALEYYLTDMGVEVRFPANGLSFDESAYELTSISILPYMGAGSSDYKGYNFIPDGSGALMRFENAAKFFTVTGKVYGDDYAYQEISNSNQEIFRMPVFGVVTSAETMNADGTVPPYKYDYVYKKATDKDLANTTVDDKGYYVDKKGKKIADKEKFLLDSAGGFVIDYEKTYRETDKNPDNKKTLRKHSSGFVAIVTEGDALTSITSLNGGGYDERHPFNSVYCSFTPRPKDSFNLSEAISVGGDDKITVVSERKYTGSFRINYIMLTDKALQTDTNRKYYDTDYVGMAKAYRDFLESKGTIKQFDEKTNENDIPLFIEAFGAVETNDTFLSIPITVTEPMTTFEQLEIMIKECKDAGINNLGLRLTGFANGGLIPTVPTKVKFEKAVGGNKGFVEFLKKATEQGVEVYPEFDFAYVHKSGSFDGFSYSRDALKTIDNRYITKRQYTAVLQTFSTTGKICISPCVYEDYFEGFDKSFTKMLGNAVTNISVGTLGSDINSDFDRDEPYNREDAKNFTLDMLKRFSVDENYGKIMVDAGNAYSMQYADIVLNAPLDSSRYSYAPESVPFFGMVYHGYVVFAGAPTNMSGDIKYETLKMLENGATFYMMLSYENVELLKKNEMLSKYYAVSYEIWKDTLFDKKDEAGNVTELGLYNKVNNALKSVQSYRIDDHKFVNCNRQLSENERINIREDAIRLVEEAEKKAFGIYDAALGKQDRYFKYLYDMREDLAVEEVYEVEYNLFDTSAKLRELMALTNNQDFLETANEALSCYVVIDGVTVYANQMILNAIVAYYNGPGKNDTEAYTWNNVYLAYCTKALEAHKNNGYEPTNGTCDGILTIMGDVETAYENYKKYESVDGKDSEMLTAEIATKTREAAANLVVNDGSVVFVQYENGKWFILNYNTFVVEITYNEIVKAVGYAPVGFSENGIKIEAKEFVEGGTK